MLFRSGDTFEARCFFEEVAELTLENTVGVFCFLLLAELCAVFRCFTTLVGSVLAGGEVTAGQYFVFAEDRFAEFTGYFGLGTCVSCHCIKISFCVGAWLAAGACLWRSRDHREVIEYGLFALGMLEGLPPAVAVSALPGFGARRGVVRRFG